MSFVRTATAQLFLLLLAPALYAQQSYSAEKPVGTTAQQLPAYLAHAGVEQRLGQPLPLTATFTDEANQTASAEHLVSRQADGAGACVLQCARCFVRRCCTDWQMGCGRRRLRRAKTMTCWFSRSIPQTRLRMRSMNGRISSGRWGLQALKVRRPDAVHFLTGQSASIAAISGATGFHYILVPGPDGKMDQFAHSSVIMFATPDGHLSKYLSGVDYPARDLRMALLDASAHKISNPVDLLILYCCSYNPVVGKYSVSVLRILSLAGMFSVVAVIGMLFLLTRKPKGRATA